MAGMITTRVVRWTCAGILLATSAMAQQPPSGPPPIPPFLLPATPPPEPAAAPTDAGDPDKTVQTSRRARYSSETSLRCRTKDSLICDLPATQPSGSACECRTSPGTMRPGKAIP
jgi:hypothetical protein